MAMAKGGLFIYTDYTSFKELLIPGITINDLLDLAPHLNNIGRGFELVIKVLQAEKGKKIKFEDFIETVVKGINNIDNKHARYLAAKMIVFYYRNEAMKFKMTIDEVKNYVGSQESVANLNQIIDNLYYFRVDDYVTTYNASFFCKYKEIEDKEVKLLMLKELIGLYGFYYVNPAQHVVFVQPELRKLKQLGIKR
jgi:hypothetical protein